MVLKQPQGDWQRHGWVKAHQTSSQEVADLLALAERDLKDCRAKGLSDDLKFSIAYNAALQASNAALVNIAKFSPIVVPATIETIMVLTIPISPEAEAKLKAKADLAGVDLTAYVAALVEQNARQPLSIAQISGPVADAFEKSGMTEDELSEVLEEAKHAMRAERRAR